ncbi:alkyl hydroperoxide reductase subunit F, partial [Salmonella enterica subsp. enterica serovar Montevideo]|nr:alkyl hydroperoxide reductase subunit F [Salmonella enterica subsp. enterica serovar Montevideo]
GRMTLTEIVAKVDTGAEKRAAEALNKRDAYDVLIVGSGPAGALKAHVSDYDVDVIDSQSASKLVPAATEGGLHQIETASGA